MPDLTPRAQAAAQARREREAAALRDNLRRRKQQARNESADATETSEAPPLKPTTETSN